MTHPAVGVPTIIVFLSSEKISAWLQVYWDSEQVPPEKHFGIVVSGPTGTSHQSFRERQKKPKSRSEIAQREGEELWWGNNTHPLQDPGSSKACD